MEKEIIEEKIIKVIENALNIKFNENIDFKYSFLDPRIGLNPRDLIVIFFEIQKEFHIKFDDSDILDKRFDFLNDITESVIKKLTME